MLPLPAPSDLPAEDMFFCWDIRRVRMGGRVCLVALNVSTSLVGVFGNLDSGYLRRLDSLASSSAYNAVRVHFGKDAAEAYLDAARPLVLTRTHGRSASGNLTQVARQLEGMEMDPDAGFQFQAAMFFNEQWVGKAAGFGNGWEMSAAERFAAKLEEFGLA